LPLRSVARGPSVRS